MTVFIFGAGSTYGTLNKCPSPPPLARDFGKCVLPESNPRLLSVASRLGKKLHEVGLEEIWSYIDYYAKFSKSREGFLDDEKWLPGAVWELKRAMLSIYGDACDIKARQIAKYTTRYTLKSLLKRVRPRDTVISFNCDTLIERLAQQLTIKLRHGTGGPTGHQVRFAKPHGSTTWRVHGLHPPDSGPPLLDSVTEESVVCGCSNTEPLVLGAVPIKSELIAEVQHYWGACDVFRVVTRQWQVVVEAIRDADVVVVVGYSFPNEDHHGRFFFMEGMRQRHKRLKRVEYYDVSARPECAIREIFGSGCKIDSKGPVQPAVPKAIRDR